MTDHMLTRREIATLRELEMPAIVWRARIEFYRKTRISMIANNRLQMDDQAALLEEAEICCLIQLLRQEPNDSESWWSLALLYIFSNTDQNTPEGIFSLKRYLELKPTETNAWILLYSIKSNLSESTISSLKTLNVIISLLSKSITPVVHSNTYLLKEVTNLASLLGINIISNADSLSVNSNTELWDNSCSAFRNNPDNALSLPPFVPQYQLSQIRSASNTAATNNDEIPPLVGLLGNMERARF